MDAVLPLAVPEAPERSEFSLSEPPHTGLVDGYPTGELMGCECEPNWSGELVGSAGVGGVGGVGEEGRLADVMDVDVIWLDMPTRVKPPACVNICADEDESHTVEGYAGDMSVTAPECALNNCVVSHARSCTNP